MVAEQEFGELRRLDVRKVWPNEASDFTPWLGENLSKLGDELGFDLELLGREMPVGPFSVDLLARDLNRDRLVVIENQLEATNHDHLGKLLTYAAGQDAEVMIWIAKEIREEHRQALDWLNQHTESSIEVYGICVEILQIDDSRPAYTFKLVAFPNEWRKSKLQGGGERGGTSERREAYRSFFQELIDRLREKHRFTGARAAQPQNWYSFASGMARISYGFSFASAAQVRTEVYIDRGDAATNKEIFDNLYREKDAIESVFGESLHWERLQEKRASRVAVYHKGSIEESSETLEEIRQWAIDHLLKFKEVFGNRLSALVHAEE